MSRVSGPKNSDPRPPEQTGSSALPATTAATATTDTSEITFQPQPDQTPFEGLRLPSPITAPASAPTEVNKPESVGVLTWCKRGITSFFGSSEVYSGAGSTILSFATDTVAGMLLHPVSSVFGAFNAFRQKYWPRQTVEVASQEPKAGVSAFLHEKFHSPGVYRVVTASVWTANTIEALWRQDYLSAAIFGLCISANAAGARLLNTDAKFAPRKPLKVEEFCRAVWDKLPDATRTILANPTISFSIASILIGVRGIDAADLGSPLILTSFALASAVSGRGAIQAIRAGQFLEPKPMSFILNGLSQIAMASANLLSGGIANGCALLCYSGSNFIFASRSAARAKAAAGRSSQVKHP